MYIIYVNHDSVIKQICQLRDKAFLINETLDNLVFILGCRMHVLRQGTLKAFVPRTRIKARNICVYE